ncbi:MAG: hypothetical protein OEW39_11780 [Deltaproteobacteria bacterium]|nr:hypothetical protein [Deltaproteobacteria bacterium]
MESKGPMRNSAFTAEPRRATGWNELLEHPRFSLVARVFLGVVLALAGYIWQAEMAHIRNSLESLKADLAETSRRQWVESGELKLELSRLNGEVTRLLEHTNQVLVRVLERTPEASRPLRHGGKAPTPGAR